MFMSSSMKAAIHLGPNYLANSEIYTHTKFEEIESLFNITQKLVMERAFWRDSECEMPGTFITFLDEISIISWSSDQMGKGKSMCLCWFRSMCWTDEGQPRSNVKMERSSGRTQDEKRHGRGNNWCELLQKWTLVLISVHRKSSQMHSRTTKRLLEKSNEWNLVRTKLVFARAKPKKRWWSAKNPAVPFSKWAMCSSLSWRNPRFDAHHACAMFFLKENLSATAANKWSPIKTWWTGSKKPSTS